jgi:hypothetical protein
MQILSFLFFMGVLVMAVAVIGAVVSPNLARIGRALSGVGADAFVAETGAMDGVNFAPAQPANDDRFAGVRPLVVLPLAA